MIGQLPSLRIGNNTTIGNVATSITTTTTTMPTRTAVPTIKVYAVRTVDHRGLRGDALLAYQTTKKNLEAEIARIAAAQPTSWALPALKSFVGELDKGTVPFNKFRNIIDGKMWGQYYTAATGVVETKILPPPPSKGFWDYVNDAGDAINAGKDWLGDQFKSVAGWACRQISSPDAQAAMAAASAILVAAGTISAGTGAVAGAAIAGAAALCASAGYGAPLPPLPTGPDTTLPGPLPGAPPTTMYPTGSITRFNETRNVWSVYAPANALAGVFGAPASDVVPPPPVGFVKVGEVATQPAGVIDAGKERDRRWYHNPWILGGIGTGTFLTLAFTVRSVMRRHR